MEERAIIDGLCRTERSRHADGDVVPCPYPLFSVNCRDHQDGGCLERQQARAAAIRFELQKELGEAIGTADGLSPQALALLLSLNAGDRWVMDGRIGQFCRQSRPAMGVTIDECASEADVFALTESRSFARVRVCCKVVPNDVGYDLALTESGWEFAKQYSRTPYDTALMALREIVAQNYGGSVPAGDALRRVKEIAETALQQLGKRRPMTMRPVAPSVMNLPKLE